MKTLELAKQYLDYVIKMRREFHMHPEASMQEYETSSRIRKELDSFGIENKICANTGVIATIKGAHPGKTVALRGDIDALAVVEETGKEYASKVPGLMHACGHDSHGAMLLGAARVLNEMRDEINGTVKLFFQPGEEVGKGAAAMVADGAMNGVDGVFGLHVASELPTGTINAQAGPVMAAGDMFKITITGKGGHGAHPEQCVDAVIVGAALTMNLQTVVSREFSPLEAIVVTVGSLHSGTRFNVIAPTAVLEGTVRYFRPDYREKAMEAIKRMAKCTAEAYRATVDIEYNKIVRPTINDDKCAQIAIDVASSIVGEKNVVHEIPSTGGEDFSEYMLKAPGVMARLGTANKDKGSDYPHHHGKFDIDEDALQYGIAYYAQYAIDFLKKYK